MKLHLDSNIVECTPEELAKYKELSHKTKREVDEEVFDAENYSILSVEAQTPSTELQVGDRVKVLKSEGGAEGEAKVTAVLEDGDVRLEGKSDNGVYSYQWSNHVSNLEKIEAKEDKPMGYTFWYLDNVNYNNYVVLKTTIDGYFETSKGKRYYQHTVSDLVKPLDREDAREKFEEAKDKGALLSYYPALDVFIRE